MEDRGWRMEDGGSRMKDGGWRIEKSLVPNLLGPKLRACELIETRPVFRPSNKDLRQENGRFFQLIHKLSVWDRTSAKLVLCHLAPIAKPPSVQHPVLRGAYYDPNQTRRRKTSPATLGGQF